MNESRMDEVAGGACTHAELFELPELAAPGSVFRLFELTCNRCGSLEVRLDTESDERAGEVVLWLRCAGCRVTERIRRPSCGSGHQGAMRRKNCGGGTVTGNS